MHAATKYKDWEAIKPLASLSKSGCKNLREDVVEVVISAKPVLVDKIEDVEDVDCELDVWFAMLVGTAVDVELVLTSATLVVEVDVAEGATITSGSLTVCTDNVKTPEPKDSSTFAEIELEIVALLSATNFALTSSPVTATEDGASPLTAIA